MRAASTARGVLSPLRLGRLREADWVAVFDRNQILKHAIHRVIWILVATWINEVIDVVGDEASRIVEGHRVHSTAEVEAAQ